MDRWDPWDFQGSETTVYERPSRRTHVSPHESGAAECEPPSGRDGNGGLQLAGVYEYQLRDPKTHTPLTQQVSHGNLPPPLGGGGEAGRWNSLSYLLGFSENLNCALDSNE